MLLFFIFSIGIFFFSRKTLVMIYEMLRKTIKSEILSGALISLMILPGTLVHETAHFVTALFLMLPVKSISFFPVFNKNEIILGEVKYEKKDYLRGAIVGVAPFFFGIAVLTGIFYWNLFPSDNWIQNVIFFYLLFAVSSNMFSSKKDLKDILFITPFIVVFLFAVYLFKIKLDFMVIDDIMKKVSNYLFWVLIVNMILYSVFRSLLKTKGKPSFWHSL